MRSIIIAGLVLILVIVGVIVLSRRLGNPVFGQVSTTPVGEVKGETAQPAKYIEFMEANHPEEFDGSNPEHAGILPVNPAEIEIKFTKKLSDKSEIKIINSGRDFGEGKIEIGSDGYSMKRKLKNNSSDYVYTVVYNACGHEGVCRAGNYQFAVGNSKTPEPLSE